MTDTAGPSAAGPARSDFGEALRANPLGLLALTVLLLLVLVSLLAPLIAPFPPNVVRINMINAPVGDLYWLGGDGSGRDILSRLVWAGQNTLTGALLAVSVAGVIGITAGLIAGYFGWIFDGVSSWIANGLMAVPPLIVLLAFYQSLGSSMYLSMIVFGVMLSPSYFRLVRNLVLAVRNELYVDAARVSGLSDGRIIVRHVLLVIRAPVIIQTAMVAGIAIVVQSGLEFLGLGNPGTPTWGGMLQNAFTNIYVAPTAIIWPGLAIALTVASLALFANAIRDSLQQGGNRPAVTRAKSAVKAAAIALPPLESPDVLLDIRDLVIGYATTGGYRQVVNGVTISVQRGEVLGLVGESGSGKTQTAFAILGLLSTGGKVLSGTINFDGLNLTAMDEIGYRALRGKRIAYVPQEPMSNLDPSFTIGDQLVEPMRAVLGLSFAAAKARALDLLERVGIVDPARVFKSYPHEVSGGMAQRVLIAGAISCNPDLLIADEPTTALDVTVQAEVLDLLRDLQREFGLTIILVTHNFGVVADSCSRVAVMQNGAVVETNQVERLFAAPQHDYTKMLLRSILEDGPTRNYRAPAQGADA